MTVPVSSTTKSIGGNGVPPMDVKGVRWRNPPTETVRMAADVLLEIRLLRDQAAILEHLRSSLVSRYIGEIEPPKFLVESGDEVPHQALRDAVWSVDELLTDAITSARERAFRLLHARVVVADGVGEGAPSARMENVSAGTVVRNEAGIWQRDEPSRSG